MSQLYRYPSSAQVTVSAVGTNGAPAPTTSIQIGGEDPSGDLQPLQVNGSGELEVSVDALPLPSGAATEAKQDDQIVLATDANGFLSDISSDTASLTQQLPAALGQAAMADSLAVVLASDQSAIPVSQSGTWNINAISGTVSLPTGASTLAEQQTQSTTLSAISGKLPATLGQKAMAASLAVVIASDQSTLPVSVSSSTLPTGAATLAEQQAQTALLTTIDADTGAIATSVASIDTKTPALVGGNVPVDVQTSVLPTGAATEATLSSLNGKVANDFGVASGAVRVAAQVGNASGAADFNLGATGAQTLRTSANIALAGTAASTGAGASDSGTQRVILASNSPSGAPTGRSFVTSARNDYSSGNVTTGAWVELIASTASTSNLLEVFDSSGQTMELGVGAAASEARICIVFPGGNGQIPIQIASGSRVSVRAVSATASVGEIDINLYS